MGIGVLGVGVEYKLRYIFGVDGRNSCSQIDLSSRCVVHLGCPSPNSPWKGKSLSQAEFRICTSDSIIPLATVMKIVITSGKPCLITRSGIHGSAITKSFWI